MKNIICAIDYSSCSIVALKYICELSKKMNTSIFVINVYNNSALGSLLEIPNILLDEVVQEKKTLKLKTFCLEHFGDSCKNLNLNYKAIQHNSIISAINTWTLKFNADLVVVGMKGVHKFKDFFIGNTTKSLIEKSVCPILAVPASYIQKKVNTIVYATDFEEADIFAIKNLVEFAKFFNSTIKIIHIAKTIEKDCSDKMEWFKELVLQHTNYKNLEFKVLFSEDILNTIHNYLEENNADILAMLERKKPDFLNKIIYIDLVKTFEAFSNIPLICYNTKNSIFTK